MNLNESQTDVSSPGPVVQGSKPILPELRGFCGPRSWCESGVTENLTRTFEDHWKVLGLSLHLNKIFYL